VLGYIEMQRYLQTLMRGQTYLQVTNYGTFKHLCEGKHIFKSQTISTLPNIKELIVFSNLIPFNSKIHPHICVLIYGTQSSDPYSYELEQLISNEMVQSPILKHIIRLHLGGGPPSFPHKLYRDGKKPHGLI
jgi:hypothetical protein